MNNTHILLVEDEEQTRFSVSIILKKSGYKVTAAADGLQALNIINDLKETRYPINFLLTDIQLPQLTGMELLEKLDEQGISIPALVITGYGDKEMVVELMRRGCEDFIDKPFESDNLIKHIGNVIAKRDKVEQENEKRVASVKEEKERLDRMLESYKVNFEMMKKQLDSAVGAYKDLIHIDEKDCKVKIAYRYQSVMELGGDFFDVKNTDKGCDILVADVAGHDMGASYHTIMIKAFFEENCRIGNNGAEFFKLLNKQLREGRKNERMVTAIFIQIDINNNCCEVISAGHPGPIIFHKRDKTPRLLNCHGNVLGVHDEVFHNVYKFGLDIGDRIFCYTDGVINALNTDAITGKREKFAVEGIRSLIEKNSGLSLKDGVNQIWQGLIDFTKYKLRDDILILGLEL